MDCRGVVERGIVYEARPEQLHHRLLDLTASAAYIDRQN